MWFFHIFFIANITEANSTSAEIPKQWTSREPRKARCSASALQGSSSLYDTAMRCVREESERFQAQALQGSLGIPAGLDLAQVCFRNLLVSEKHLRSCCALP